MKHLKLFFACMLMLLFGFGQLWAEDEVAYTLDGTTTGGSNGYATESDITQSGISWKATGNTTLNPWRIGGNSLDGVDRPIYSTTAITDDITKIEIEHGTASSITVNSMTVIVATDAAFTSVVSTCTPSFVASNTVTINHPSGDDAWENCYYKIVYNVTVSGNNNKFVQFKGAKFYKEKSASDPSLSADPMLIDFGTVDVGATVASQTVAVSFANLTGSVTYSGLTDPFSASGAISATGDEITISADATNAGTFQQTLTIQSAADSKSVEVTVKMKVTAPTGTFEPFSENIEEGDYLIVADGAGMNTTVTSNRLQYTALTLTGENYVNPDVSVIWHIAASATEGYWTIYNEDDGNYAAATGSNNQAQMLASGTDDKSLWTITHSGAAYTIQNKSNSRYLKKNGTYGFACYGDGTVSLYKLSNGKEAAGLAYDAADAQKLVKVGGTLTAPTLTNPNSLAVTYASNNTSIAEVNETTGAVTIKSAAGVAVITASTVGDATHNPGSASYTIFVAEHAGTESDPLSEANAKTLIDDGCTLTAHVNGLVLSQDDGNYTVTLTNGFKFYKAKDLGNVAFTSAYLGVGDEVTAVGQLTKYNTTYELAEGCYLTFYEAATTPLTPIANDEATAYTVEQALIYAAAPTTYDLSDIVYVRGKVAIASTALFNNKYLTYSISDDGTTTNVLKVYNGLGIGGDDFTSKDDILVGEVVVVKGNLTQYNTELELAANNELVSKKPVATIAIDNMAMEYGDVATISATITPAAAASTIVYNIKAGSDDVITLAGDEITAKSVTGTATIVATIAGTDDYEGATKEFTVSVSEGDTRKTATITSFSAISGDLTPSDISYAAYQGGAQNAPNGSNAANELRLYKYQSTTDFGGYVTVKAKKGCTIDQVVITVSANAKVGYCKDNETLPTKESTPISVGSSTPFDTGTGLNADSIRVVNIDGSNQLKIVTITVYYTGDPLSVDHYILGGTYQTTFEQNGTFDYTGLKVYAAYDAGETITEEITGFVVEADLTTAGNKKAEVMLNSVKIAEYDITVTAGKEDPALAYSPVSETITAGDAWSAPTLSNTFSVSPITYSSDKESVATVTSEGVITLAGGYGTAVITAHFDESAEYIESEATYTITVNKPAPTPTSTIYRKVTATADITDGEYLIVYEGDATHDAAVFDGSLDDANIDVAKKALPVAIVSDEIAGNTDLDAAVFTIDVTAGSLQSASGYYIGRTENSNGMEKNNVTTYSNTFAITEGKAVITSEGGPTLRYNYASDQLRFRYYKTGQQDIQLYKKVIVTPPTPAYTDIRTGLTAGNYYTVCWPKAMTAIKGGTLWSFAGKDASMAYLVQQTAPFVAGRPYIIYATDTKLEAVVEGDDATAGNYNGLYGTLSYMDADALSSAGATYMLKSNELRPIGTNNHLDANRAYVILDNITGGKPAGVPAHMVRSMPLKQDTTTGMDNLNASETPVKVMINGQMYILRGEKMYNANGQLVK